MRLVALEDALGPAEEVRYIGVYVCTECGRLGSYEYAKVESRQTLSPGAGGKFSITSKVRNPAR
jgi:hypothetical protein